MLSVIFSLASRREAFFLAAIVVGLVITAPASAFQLVPISQEFDPSGRGATKTFQLQNETDQPAAVTVTMATRAMGPNGEESNAETEDFIVAPEQAIIPPRGIQTVRVQWVGEPDPDRELAYRIIAEQMPVAFQPRERGGAVQLVIRYVGSVYVVPKTVRADVKLESAAPRTNPGGKPELELVLANTGTGHAIIEEPVLTLQVGGRKRELREAELPGVGGMNILAGVHRRVVLPWPADLPVGPVQGSFSLRPGR